MSYFIHGDNIKTKFKNEKQEANIDLLKEIQNEYIEWNKQNLQIKGINKEDIEKKVILLNKYKDFVDNPKFKKEGGNKFGFTFQSKLHSTVIEEFMYYLFKDITCLENKKINYGSIKAYTNLYFAPANIGIFEKKTGIVINVKDQDFTISKKIILKSKTNSSKEWEENHIYVPIISIECKTYLDKTMYEGSVATAEKIKKGNPYSLFIIVTETYEVSLEVDPKYSDIDQIYILRKQKRRSNNSLNPIDFEVVYDLFKFVENHLNSDWKNIESKIEKGKMI